MSTKSVLAGATNDIGFQILRNLSSGNQTDNFFISPLSIVQALGLAHAGADGKTRAEIGNLLGADTLTDEQFDKAILALMSSLKSDDPKIQFSIANAIWADSSCPFLEVYKESCATYYSAVAESLDFRLPESADTINRWVSSATGGYIPIIVTSEEISPLTSAVLTNALFFKGVWTNTFKPRHTRSEPFTLDSGERIEVETMHQFGQFQVFENTSFRAISLPYGDALTTRMLAIVPMEGYSASQLLDTLGANLYAQVASELRAVGGVRLQVPKFKFDCECRLAKVLKTLGMRSAFQPGANFSRMGSGHDSISDVIHKSTIEVNEAGTVATAATFEPMLKGDLEVGYQFSIDRPFLCAISDITTNLLLFLGLINYPHQENMSPMIDEGEEQFKAYRERMNQ